MQIVWIVTGVALEGSPQFPGLLGRCQSCAPTEYQQVRKGVSAQTIRAVKTGGSFARREESRHVSLRSLSIYTNSTHHVVARRPYLHGSFGDIHVSKLTELVIHTGQFFLHVFSGFVRDVKIGAAMFSAATFLRFGVDCARYYITRREFHLFRIISLHKALAVFVRKNAAFAAHGFSDQNSLHARGPDHSGGMKLYELHIHQISAGVVS